MSRIPFRPVLLAVFGLAGLTTAATAQPASSCLALTDAMGLAAARAPEVAGAQARLAQAEAEARAARSLRRPQVSTFGRSSVGDTGLTTSQIENQVGVQVSQRLYDFGDARLAETAARNQVDQRTYEIEAQEAESGGLASVLEHAQAELERVEQRAAAALGSG